MKPGGIAVPLNSVVGRPFPPGSVPSLYWLLGAWDAARGKSFDSCPYREGKKSREWWQMGFKANTDLKVANGGPAK